MLTIKSTSKTHRLNEVVLLLRIIILTGYIIISFFSHMAVAADEFTVLISDKETGRIILSETVKSGDILTLRWKNSLFLLDVTETYTIRDTFFEQTGIIFHDPDGKDEPVISACDVDDVYHTGGPFKAVGLSRPFKGIVFRIGEIGNPVIRLKERDIDLKSKVGFGNAVILEIKNPHELK